MKSDNFLDGQVILVDKPLHWTSFQVVNKLRWAIKKKCKIKKIKVGHAGTLDPLATGLLIICTGKFTKKIDQFQAQIKEYTGTITLGSSTPSFDLETEKNQTYPTKHITNESIYAATKNFIGEIEQYPPIFSALKKDGVKLYELARKGQTTNIQARKITIYNFEITKIAMPNIDFKVLCSKGTYIRSLANDFGKALDSGSHLSKLRRTQSGDFKVENAISPEDFVKNLNSL